MRLSLKVLQNEILIGSSRRDRFIHKKGLSNQENVLNLTLEIDLKEIKHQRDAHNSGADDL